MILGECTGEVLGDWYDVAFGIALILLIVVAIVSGCITYVKTFGR